MKLLSIAIPCYNSEKYMRKCIDSLLIGGEDVEILIIDDGSTKDRTAEIADEYEAQFPTIVRAIHKENGGHGSAVNTGIANATGLYFKVVDSDDWVKQDAYFKILDTLRELAGGGQALDMLISNYVYEKEGGMVENIMEFPREQMVRYGALVGAVRDGRVVRAKGLVEKPALENVPSNYASMGPYILPNEIMQILPEVRKGTNGEINLTDAMELAAQRGMKLTGVLCDVLRFDCGTNKDLERSNIKLSLMEDADLRAYTCELLKTMLV